MGISGLLPLLKSIHRTTEVKKFAGETLGIDGYGWLHRGATACAIDLALGQPTRKYVDFSMHRICMLKHYGVTPYVVFDGDFLPSKAATEASRAKRREKSKKSGLELLKAGRTSQAHLELQKAIDVAPEMARQLIEELKKAGVPYLVAPYEADSQLVYLERQGHIAGIISEDSDLLVFGARRLLTKMDRYGQCIEINRRDFCAVREVCLTGWTDREFRQMAIFSGCDYLDSISNMGLKTAHRMLRKHKTPERVIQKLQFEGKHQVSENYPAAFKQTELTFLHQRVFCPVKKEVVFLTEPDPSLDVENMSFIGAPVERDLAQAIAMGDVNPITKKVIEVAGLPNKRKINQITAFPTASKPPLGKPIDEYFKSRAHSRTPLGEMRANCFYGQPRQAGVSTENRMDPRVFPLPRPYIDTTDSTNSSKPYTPKTRVLRRRTESIANLIDHGNSNKDAVSRRQTTSLERLGDGDSWSLPRPPKKARLCHDYSIPDVSKQTNERSKYFSPPTGRHDATFLAENSLEDALEAFSHNDIGKSRCYIKAAGKLKIFLDPPAQNTGFPGMPEGSTPSGPSGDDVEVTVSSPLGPTLTDEPIIKSPFETPSIRADLRQFSYTANLAQSPSSSYPGPTRFAHGLPTPTSSVTQRRTKATRPVLSASGTPMRTPLQRIGAQALSRGHDTISSPAVHPLSSSTKQRHRSFKYVPMNPNNVPLPKVDVAEIEALNNECGSEDQIVPESDGENEVGYGDEVEKEKEQLPSYGRISPSLCVNEQGVLA